MKVVTVVAAALIDEKNQVLVAQRPQGKHMAGLWEFPGGKLEAGETPEAALVRELREELSIIVDAAQLQAVSFVSHAYEDFHLLMLLYGCRQWQGQVSASEHSGLKWTGAEALSTLAMPPADAPLLEPLAGFIRKA